MTSRVQGVQRLVRLPWPVELAEQVLHGLLVLTFDLHVHQAVNERGDEQIKSGIK